jgi:hypothetical protein
MEAAREFGADEDSDALDRIVKQMASAKTITKDWGRVNQYLAVGTALQYPRLWRRTFRKLGNAVHRRRFHLELGASRK